MTIVFYTKFKLSQIFQTHSDLLQRNLLPGYNQYHSIGYRTENDPQPTMPFGTEGPEEPTGRLSGIGARCEQQRKSTVGGRQGGSWRRCTREYEAERLVPSGSTDRSAGLYRLFGHLCHFGHLPYRLIFNVVFFVFKPYYILSAFVNQCHITQ